MTQIAKKRTRNWTKKKLLFFSFVAVFIILIFLEIAFRIAFYFQYKNLQTTIQIQGSPLQTSDSILIYRNQPFYIDYNKKYQNNEEGMKGATGDVFISKKTGRDFWVLLTGGSAMEGMGSNQNGKWLDITGVDDHPYHETIAYYLEQLLQKKMPERKVKVFNAATSGYTVYQSYLRYLSLSQKLYPDWVISMDGVNEPSALSEKQTINEYLKKEWRQNPQFHYPLKMIIPMTKNSALINYIKQKLFHFKRTYRLEKAKNKNYSERKKWANMTVPAMKFAVSNPNIERATQNFAKWIIRYDSILSKNRQKHLLLIQPHMSQRDTSSLTLPEIAVSNYYRGTFQDTAKHQFLKIVYKQFAEDVKHPAIVPMTAVHHWSGWTLVDYCHFTNDATKRIATEIARYIFSDGAQKPFQ